LHGFYRQHDIVEARLFYGLYKFLISANVLDTSLTLAASNLAMEFIQQAQKRQPLILPPFWQSYQSFSSIFIAKIIVKVNRKSHPTARKAVAEPARGDRGNSMAIT